MEEGQCIGGPFDGMVPRRWDRFKTLTFGNNASKLGMDVLPSDKVGDYRFDGTFWQWENERPAGPDFIDEPRMVQS